jgi:AcrR family transcriptional regulator
MNTPPRPRKSQRGTILATFAAMVAERGYDAVSHRDVADALGMSKGTIVHHFRTKELILEEVHRTYMRRRLDEAVAILARLDTPAERLAGLVHQLLIAQRDDRNATVAFAREISRFAADESMRAVRTMREEYFELLEGVIREGMAEGSLEPGDATLITLQVFGSCNWAWTWFRPDGDRTAEEIAASFSNTVLRGLMPRDGELPAIDMDAISSVIHDVMTRAPEAVPS